MPAPPGGRCDIAEQEQADEARARAPQFHKKSVPEEAVGLVVRRVQRPRQHQDPHWVAYVGFCSPTSTRTS